MTVKMERETDRQTETDTDTATFTADCALHSCQSRVHELLLPDAQIHAAVAAAAAASVHDVASSAHDAGAGAPSQHCPSVD